MTATPEHQCPLSRSDFADSLLFKEEVDVRQGMGEDLDTMLMSGFQSKAIRALIYAHRRRESDTVKQARQYAEGLSRVEMLHYFASDEDENADQGKGGSATGGAPPPSPSGA